jgi:formylglycine-generating enzyme required for sulfatase activity
MIRLPVTLFAVLSLTVVGFASAAVVAPSNDLGEMIRIPAGVFVMGSNDGPADERPQHRVEVAEFFIDRTKVTNASFALFLNAIGPEGPKGEIYFDIDDSDARVHRRNGEWTADAGFENNPVVEASWYGAVAFCRWAGKRLPTEAEWEKAARGTDGRKYPWGDEAPDRTRAHFGAGWNELKPVGSFPNGASPYRLLDAAGNGWEWVSSAYRPYPYNLRDGREDLNKDMVRTTRGGGHDARSEELTATHRGRHVSRNPHGGHHNIGFRCAR